jgi:CO dehydrogenase nickel-insertion accessory protein CooC1
LIVDSVAGNDAFGTTLFLNDILLFIVKPEREGVAVLQRFLALAEKAGVSDKLFVIGNQITSPAQREFLEREVPAERLIGVLENSPTVIERRLANLPLGLESIDDQMTAVFETIADKAAKLGANQTARYKSLLDLHSQVANESWVAGSYRTGLQDQIDSEYQPE